jgi:hypothetical protein
VPMVAFPQSLKDLEWIKFMPTPTLNGIRTITEQSLVALFNSYSSSLSGVQLHAGQTDELRSVPVIIFHAESANAHKDFGAYWLGNFEITVKIYIYSSADDNTLAEHRQRVETVQGIMQDLNGIKSFWNQGELYQCWMNSDDEGVADRRYGNILSYTLVAVYPPLA